MLLRDRIQICYWATNGCPPTPFQPFDFCSPICLFPSCKRVVRTIYLGRSLRNHRTLRPLSRESGSSHLLAPFDRSHPLFAIGLDRISSFLFSLSTAPRGRVSRRSEAESIVPLTWPSKAASFHVAFRPCPSRRLASTRTTCLPSSKGAISSDGDGSSISFREYSLLDVLEGHPKHDEVISSSWPSRRATARAALSRSHACDPRIAWSRRTPCWIPMRLWT